MSEYTPGDTILVLLVVGVSVLVSFFVVLLMWLGLVAYWQVGWITQNMQGTHNICNAIFS